MQATETQSRKAWWLLSPALLLYALTFFVPFVVLVVMSFATFEKSVTTLGFDLTHYVKFFTDGVNLPVFWNTVLISAYITGACLLVGYPVAAYMRSCGPTGRLLMLFMIVSPLLTSIIVRNVAWMLILGNSGMINGFLRSVGLIERPLPLMYNEFAVVLAVVHVYLPFMILPIFAALASIDRSIEEGAASLGASPLRVFRSVTLPLSTPGVMAGCTLVFILSMGIYVTPVLMGGNKVLTLPMIITDKVRNAYNWPAASAMAIVLLLFICLLIFISGRLQTVRGRQ